MASDGSTFRFRDADVSLVIVHDSADESLAVRACDLGWAVRQASDPIAALVAVCLQERRARDRSTWGLPVASSVMVVLTETGRRSWPSEIDELCAAIDRWTNTCRVLDEADLAHLLTLAESQRRDPSERVDPSAQAPAEASPPGAQNRESSQARIPYSKEGSSTLRLVGDMPTDGDDARQDHEDPGDEIDELPAVSAAELRMLLGDDADASGHLNG